MNDNRKNVAHYRLEIDLLIKKLRAIESEIQMLRTQNKAYKELFEAMKKYKQMNNDIK